MSKPLLGIRNQHTASCGDLPFIDGSDGKFYIGYFENDFGEQWFFHEIESLEMQRSVVVTLDGAPVWM